MSFHLAVAAAWAIVFLIGHLDQRLGLARAMGRTLLAFLLAFSLSYGAAYLFPEAPECHEQTPTGRGLC